MLASTSKLGYDVLLAGYPEAAILRPDATCQNSTYSKLSIVGEQTKLSRGKSNYMQPRMEIMGKICPNFARNCTYFDPRVSQITLKKRIQLSNTVKDMCV